MEDVNFMYEHAKEESCLFLVNSDQRDISTYPDPEEYAIQFDVPFRNVFGLELLDATCPRTEYTIESYNNTLAYTVGTGLKRTLQVEPGDYNLPQLVTALNVLMSAFLDVDGMQTRATSNPYQLSSRITFFARTDFTLHMAESTMAKALGFGPRTYRTVDVAPSVGAPLVAFTGPYADGNMESLNSGRLLRQRFRASQAGGIERIVMRAQGSPTIQVRVIDSSSNVYATGTLFPEADTSADLTELETFAPLQVGSYYYIELVVLSGEAFVFTGSPSDGVPVETAVSAEGPWTSSVSGRALCFDVYVTVNLKEISSPGLVDLTGQRVVLIRCPEIEQHMFRERAYEKFHAGLGAVKLAISGLREQRFDFLSFPARRFHPIGKLSTLRFRLEKTDGTLYNCKLVDHTLLFVVRYYSIVPSLKQPTNTLMNPHYNPDVRSYLVNTKWRADAEEAEQIR